jgi:ATP-binding cassette subfamily B protein/subfamily B ATP-binding cassette protein MsbA
MNGHSADEKEIGKVFDRKIAARLIRYMRPFLKYLAFSAVFLIIAAAVELSYPFLIKTSIDNYIVKSGRKATGQLSPGFIPLKEDRWFATQSILGKTDPAILRRAERDGKLLPERYYYVFKSEADDRIRTVIARNPADFEEYPDLYIIAYDRIRRLTGRDLMALRHRDYSGIMKIVLIFAVIIFTGAIANFVQIYLTQYAGQQFMHEMRLRVFRKLQHSDLSFFDRNPVGRLVTRATNDVEAINEAFSQVFTTLFRDILMLAGIIIIMLTINVRLALICFVVIPLVLIMTSYFRIRARDIYREVRTRLARLNATLQENYSGIRVIKIFNQQTDNQARFDRVNEDYLRVNLKEVVLMSFFRPIIEIISSLGIGLIIYYGGGQVMMGKISLGVIVAFTSYVEMFFRPIRELTESYTLLQSAMASSERIFLLLDEEIKIRPVRDPRPLDSVKGEIEFRKVWFSYQEPEWVLKDVSFRVAPGEHVAIVGPTGAGKTSIISLISRLYEIQRGQILIDGIDIRDVPPAVLRAKIGVVMQDVFLFAGDIKSNIRLNRPLTDEAVKTIAAYINADRFIDRFPNKFDENVMERGVTFSTGERQLLSFARVLAFDPRILVLDEATANIDTETERLIQEGLKKLMVNRTSIIIAHRLSTIKEVDRIYVIHKGEIKETGTHPELLARKGIYYNLYKLQSLQQ